MGSKKETKIFKKGIWIIEQQGVLTVGSLDEKNADIMVVPDELRAKLQTLESDMIEALYGENRDSESVSNPSDLGPDFFLVKNRLSASVEFNKAEKQKGDYDITIPSADR
ncbi:hypothetical protein DO021_12280 [Desulfobacter hydrogenophilus]|uniref:Uncharacterized protein n=1 Tax=Desulfobacter hydrogenophilus TaxID=2291 RepID=A0A328FFB9_9BACT|nr:hypothetical protein [Desulfobacter hydrogenophilus]NDY72441.1 hypothetical protein [Desulfobacter hydrogenophilus]QBH13763.1 hypothetical protein EYB58_13030 [Desulfobacter hydrogenophilus]RAM01707.1 hypothetical protein DO021_12280 [Desulfobacter hydrogenophilus]